MPLFEGDTPCWEARCDKCGDGDGHFDTMAELVAVLEACGWLIIEGYLFYCDVCADDLLGSMRNLRTAWIN